MKRLVYILFTIFVSLSPVFAIQDGIITKSNQENFSLYFEEKDTKLPFVKVEKLPKITGKSVSLEKYSNRLENYPFVLNLDVNLDGEFDLELAPEKFCETKKDGKIGAQVNMYFKARQKKGMPCFDRIELQLHDQSYLKSRKFKINRIVIKRLKDGNLQITLRDKFYKTGKDKILYTKFKW